MVVYLHVLRKTFHRLRYCVYNLVYIYGPILFYSTLCGFMKSSVTNFIMKPFLRFRTLDQVMIVVGTIITHAFLLEKLLTFFVCVALVVASLVLPFILLLLVQGFIIVAITDYIVQKLVERHVFIVHFSVASLWFPFIPVGLLFTEILLESIMYARNHCCYLYIKISCIINVWKRNLKIVTNS